MINAIDKPAIFITSNYRIHAVNQKYLDTYFGNTHFADNPIELGSSHCYEISHQSSKPCEQHGEDCPIHRCQQTQESASALHIHETGTGHAYCDILMQPVLDDDGMTIGFLEILEHVSYAASSPEQNKLIGISKPFQAMLKLINRSAKSDLSVLLQGETGTGKELAAQAIHQVSHRSDNPFLVVECTGLTEALFESELFGHEKGAFTGATHAKKGLVGMADGGTLFLDEIGDIPLNLQVKLLRLLETGKYRPVGAVEQKSANFRLISASHKNLPKMVEQGLFRNDLYYRIAGFPIELPSLNQRIEDIPILAEHILKHSEFSEKSFTEQALATLCQYAFPGNIRELKNIVLRSALISDSKRIDTQDLPNQISSYEAESAQEKEQLQPINGINHLTGGQVLSLEQLEQTYIQSLLNQYQGDMDLLAKKLNVSKRTIYRKLKK